MHGKFGNYVEVAVGWNDAICKKNMEEIATDAHLYCHSILGERFADFERISREKHEAGERYRGSSHLNDSGREGLWYLEEVIREALSEMWRLFVLLNKSKSEHKRRGTLMREEKLHQSFWPWNPQSVPTVNAIST